MARTAWSLAAGLFLLAGCKAKPSPPAPPPDAGHVAAFDAGPPDLPRFAGMGTSACLLYPDGAAWCGKPTRDAIAFRRLSAEPVIDTSPHRACFLTKSGEAFCDRKRVAEDVKSVSGAPYLLGRSGQIIVPERSEFADADAVRSALVPTLPALERIVGADSSSCALSTTGEVWCWADPTLGFNTSVEAPVAPRPKAVPGQRDVVDLTLTRWLTLCTRTKRGVVMCTSGASGETEVCELRGSRDARCGMQSRQLMGPQPLVGVEYNPRTVLERPLAPVPGLDGTDPATSLHAWSGASPGMLESGRRLYIYGGGEGGCARLESAAIRCWERDICRQGMPWRSTDVQDLPNDVARVELGAWHGYALTAGGAVFTWPRHARGDIARPNCATDRTAPFVMRAERVPLAERTVDVGGSQVWLAGLPTTGGVDCAISSSATVTCWVTDASKRTPLTVTRSDPKPDAGGPVEPP